MIDFINVKKSYPNGTSALDGVDLHVDDGEFVFIVGHSGAGKTTMMKLLLREEAASSGSLVVSGYDLSKIKNREIPFYRRELGVVFQDFRLFPSKTVYENVAFAMQVVGTPRSMIKRRVPAILTTVNLADKMTCFPRELSGGEQQRVALARALVNNADIIIADEPTGNVDPQMSLEIVELLKRLNETGTTVIMVTHAHDLVKKFDNRVIVLDSGEVVSDGLVENGEIPIHSSSHLNVQPKGKIKTKFKKFGKKNKAEIIEDGQKGEDETFLDALVGDTDSYRVYLEEEEKPEAAVTAEEEKGGDGE